jgi:hypothetical protein
MRDLLHRIRTRVDRLVAGVACDGSHVVTKVSLVPLGEPVPDWPPADAAETCGICGAPLEYTHLIHMQEADDASARRSALPTTDAGRVLTH